MRSATAFISGSGKSITAQPCSRRCRAAALVGSSHSSSAKASSKKGDFDQRHAAQQSLGTIARRNRCYLIHRPKPPGYCDNMFCRVQTRRRREGALATRMNLACPISFIGVSWLAPIVTPVARSVIT